MDSGISVVVNSGWHDEMRKVLRELGSDYELVSAAKKLGKLSTKILRKK